MPYYNTCPNCGANLDPGEPCDCEIQKELYSRHLKTEPGTGQLLFMPVREDRNEKKICM